MSKFFYQNKDHGGLFLRVESVARGVIHIIRVGENGSVWVTEDEKEAFKIDIPDYGLTIH